MAAGTTDNETKWQLGKQLTTREHCMGQDTMDSLDYDYYFWNKNCRETSQCQCLKQEWIACIDSSVNCYWMQFQCGITRRECVYQVVVNGPVYLLNLNKVHRRSVLGGKYDYLTRIWRETGFFLRNSTDLSSM